MDYTATTTFHFPGDLTDLGQFPTQPIQEIRSNCSTEMLSATVTTVIRLHTSGEFIVTAGRVVHSWGWDYFRRGQMDSVRIRGEEGAVVTVQVAFNAPMLISWSWGVGVFPADCQIPAKYGFLARCLWPFSHNSVPSVTVDTHEEESQPQTGMLPLVTFTVVIAAVMAIPLFMFRSQRPAEPPVTVKPVIAQQVAPVSSETVSAADSPTSDERIKKEVQHFLDVVQSTPEGRAAVQRIENKDDALTQFQRENGISDAVAEQAIKEWVLSHNGEFDYNLSEVKRICLRLRN